ncbi:MAG: hypothetical protein MHM6MM_000858 [Cercozoa sp. M6MM]
MFRAQRSLAAMSKRYLARKRGGRSALSTRKKKKQDESPGLGSLHFGRAGTTGMDAHELQWQRELRSSGHVIARTRDSSPKLEPATATADDFKRLRKLLASTRGRGTVLGIDPGARYVVCFPARSGSARACML